MKKMILSCKEVVKSISSDEKNHWSKQLEISFHLFMCHHCGKYAKHLKILKTSINKVFSFRTQFKSSKDVIELEDKIVASLKK